MADMASMSREELEASLVEYRAQLQQVEQLLLLEENVNEELQDMYNSLTEVIQLTEDLLKEAAGSEAQAAAQQRGAPGPSAGAGPSTSGAAAPAVAPPQLNLPSILPASVADQIRRAQIKAALSGQAPAAWAIGAPVQALYAPDQQYYNAVVKAVAPSGQLVVAYEGYEEQAEVLLSCVRERPESTEIYTGVAAPKRKRVEDAPVVEEMPKWLVIKEDDDDKTVARKKKLIKSYKSKKRFHNMDMAQKKKADSWQSFNQGKGTKKKTGYFTGRKKESIFKTGEGLTAKVGVTGSGKGMTEYVKPKPVGGLPEADE